jgi:hypothetical protein
MGADEADIPKGEKAAGQPGGKRRSKPPVTIDLQAEPVAAEPPGQAEASVEPPPEPPPETAPPPEPPRSGPAEPPPERPGSPGIAMLAAAGAIGGLIVLALGFGLQAAGILPTPGRDIALQAHAAGADLSAKLAGLDQRLQSIEAASSQTIADRALLDDVARRVGVADAFGNSLDDRVLTLEASVAALEKANDAGGPAAQQSIDALTARVAELEARPSNNGDVDGDMAAGTEAPAAPAPAATPQPDITALEQRVTALEAKIALVASQPPSEPSAPAPTGDSFARADALAALRAASAQGGNFGSELAVVGSFGVGGSQVAALAPLAEKNVPTSQTLIREFPEVANGILAVADDANGGIVGDLLAYGRSFVRVRPSEPIAGDHPEAVVSRIEASLKAENLAAAHAEWEKLPAAEKKASQAWADQLADRSTIDRLVEELASALSASAGSG